jgi:hypothetical protein
VPQSLPTVAAVSFLNARPLIDGLETEPAISLLTDVPSRLLENLITAQSRVALCPVIDFQVAAADLCIVPVGAIGSDGPTHTVRVFSSVPIADIERVHVDGDSHTSVALLQVVLDELYGGRPDLETLANNAPCETNPPQAVLLIGDKVVQQQSRGAAVAAPTLPTTKRTPDPRDRERLRRRLASRSRRPLPAAHPPIRDRRARTSGHRALLGAMFRTRPHRRSPADEDLPSPRALKIAVATPPSQT